VRILRGVYEGPGSHGILRIAAGMENVHAILRALPDEGDFPAIFGARGRTGRPAAVTLSPLRERDTPPGGASSPGLLDRDIINAARRHPEAQALILARSETALLQREDLPEVSLPENEKTGHTPKLVLCDWESASVPEITAADLALEDLVRAHSGPREKSTLPSVNVFGPPLFGPGAAAEVDEAERLLQEIGVEVNARLPIGTTVEDLSNLTRAWANVVLYREVGDSAALYLQDEFGMPRVTTPMVGSAGTGAVLRGVGDLCRLDASRVRRVVFAELAERAKLAWYVRMEPPETFEGRRVVLFGDFTYCVGLGYVLAREVGLDVAWSGTYLHHMERDFLFHAGSFTDRAFVTDDPDEVATLVEDTGPDLVIGTHLEEGVAASLNIPFLPLCAPTASEPFVQRPLMGYEGSGVLADALAEALTGSPAPRETQSSEVTPWTAEALEELAGIPAFLRGRARRLAEERAHQRGAPEVTPEILDEARS
jgi:light-independent protochlorophyllide reductase subunit B